MTIVTSLVLTQIEGYCPKNPNEAKLEDPISAK